MAANVTEVAAPASRSRDMAKRGLDLLLASVALVTLSPLLLVIAALIRATSPGPALFSQERVGHRRRTFVVFKFRTMHADSDDSVHRAYVTRLLTDDEPPDGGQEGLYKLHADPRVTRVGEFLRRTSLDELPQLLNVVRGDMSLVGPRPCLAWEVELYRPEHLVRFETKPGLTGLWQVRGRNALTMTEALDLDVEYVGRRSVAMDLGILAKTVPVVLGCRGSR